MIDVHHHNSKMTYQYDLQPTDEVIHLKAKSLAFRSLFGRCNLAVRGTWLEPDGELVFMTYRDCPVVEIGRKYLTVDLGHEGHVKLTMSGGEHRRVILTNREV